MKLSSTLQCTVNVTSRSRENLDLDRSFELRNKISLRVFMRDGNRSWKE